MRYSASNRRRTICCWSTKTIPLLLAASLLAVSAPAGADETIWEDKEQFVRLESQGDSSARANDHPIDLSGTKIKAALESLQADFPKVESPVQVFTAGQVELLGDALSRGLARAGSRQDVTFTLIDTHNMRGVVRSRRVNTGRVFYAEGKLNIIFGEVLGEYRKKNVYGQRDEDFRPRVFAKRASAAEHKWRIVLGSSVAFHQRGDTERDDWLQIDTALTSASKPEELPPATASQAESSAAAAAISPPPEPATPPLPVEPVPPPPPVVPAEAPTGAAQAEAKTLDAADSPSDLEDRLKRLKELREKDLISDEVYEQKMREILSEL